MVVRVVVRVVVSRLGTVRTEAAGEDAEGRKGMTRMLAVLERVAVAGENVNMAVNGEKGVM